MAYENAEADELTLLKKRGFNDYSRGHQLMYTTCIEAIRETGPIEILDVGSGIGWGWQQMLKAMPQMWYTGVEQHEQTAKYHNELLKKAGRIPTDIIYHGDWLEVEQSILKADVVFCMEVIEHVNRDQAANFLRTLRTHARETVFLSTPEPKKSSHGRYGVTDINVMALHAGFTGVAWIRRQWTTLYILPTNNP